MRNYQDGILKYSYKSKQKKGICDLNAMGERWEGDFIDGVPYGMGLFYNEDNKLVYHGIMINGVRDIWGISYYPDSENVQYIGVWKHGSILSAKQVFDKTGALIGDQPFGSEFSRVTHLSFCLNGAMKLPMIVHYLTTMRFDRYVGNHLATLKIVDMPFLKTISIGSKCFNRCRRCELCNLPCLTSFEVGEFSFSIRIDEQVERALYIKSCISLQRIGFGKISFRQFSVLSLSSTGVEEY